MFLHWFTAPEHRWHQLQILAPGAETTFRILAATRFSVRCADWDRKNPSKLTRREACGGETQSLQSFGAFPRKPATCRFGGVVRSRGVGDLAAGHLTCGEQPGESRSSARTGWRTRADHTPARLELPQLQSIARATRPATMKVNRQAQGPETFTPLEPA